ncbi:unnamed protein product [Cylindrotheca closterium]|uniref:Uncharacterized protein n=1 Tax=Cylindrotheca closterium TaxID=2856 RepID=A0AAD2G8P7_9STRA|nr:unnamed protein product [Cylindrotheca closterium]
MPYLVSAKDANTGDKLSMEDVVDAAGHLRFDPEELVLKIENRMPPVEHQRGQQNMDLMNLSHTNKFHSVELDGYWHRFDDSDILRSSARRSHTLILGNAVISDLVLILQDDQTIQNLKTLEYFENDVNRESFISYEGEGRRVVETLASELKQLAQLQKLAFHNIPISIQTLYSALNDNDYGSGLKCDVKKLCLHRCEIAMMQKTNVESEILASSFGLRIILPPNMNLVPGNAEKEQSIWTDSRDDPEAKWVKNTTVTELHWSGTNDKRWDWEWPPFAVVGALLDGFANLKRLTLERCGLHKLDGLIPYLSAEDCKLECLDVQYNDLDCEAMMDFFFV